MKKIFLLIIITFTAVYLHAQETKIKGKVSDLTTQGPIANASIIVKGKIAGTITDSRGGFYLTVDHLKLRFTIVISSMGYAPKEIAVNSLSVNVIVSLKPASLLLNEVVTAATRVNQNILESPVSIEKMNAKAITENRRSPFTMDCRA